MSLKFNSTADGKGIVQIYEKEIGVNAGDISGNTAKLKAFTADCNLAHDDLLDIGFKAGGTWQVDDTNYVEGDGDYPIVKTNIVSGRRDYVFLEDEYGNLILDIYKVWVADASGNYTEVLPVDEFTANNNGSNTDSFTTTQTGVPTNYDKLGNGIRFNLIFNYNYTNGVRVAVNREGSYFEYTDTTKKPGVPGNLHRYYALKPAKDYARRHLSNDTYTKISNEVLLYEGDETRGIVGKIGRTFGQRQKDQRGKLKANIENTR